MAVALLGVSSSAASARVWKDAGTNVTNPFQLGLTGGEIVESGSGGLSCQISATLTGESGSKGTITQFTTKKCVGFGTLASCTLASSEAQGLPWSLNLPAAVDMTAAEWHLRRTFQAGCAATELNKTIPTVSFAFDSTAAISEMEFLGETSGYKAFGSLSVNAPNAGTYGIG